MRKLLLHSAKFKRRYEQTDRVCNVYEIPFDGISSMDIDDIHKFMRDIEQGLYKYFQKNPHHKCFGNLIHATDFWPGSVLVHISDLP